jgi:hypothetical protein
MKITHESDRRSLWEGSLSPAVPRAGARVSRRRTTYCPITLVLLLILIQINREAVCPEPGYGQTEIRRISVRTIGINRFFLAHSEETARKGSEEKIRILTFSRSKCIDFTTSK